MVSCGLKRKLDSTSKKKGKNVGFFFSSSSLLHMFVSIVAATLSPFQSCTFPFFFCFLIVEIVFQRFFFRRSFFPSFLYLCSSPFFFFLLSFHEVCLSVSSCGARCLVVTSSLFSLTPALPKPVACPHSRRIAVRMVSMKKKKMQMERNDA